MATYQISARNRAGALGLEQPLSAAAAYYRIRELKAAGYAHITLTNVETGEVISDVERLVRDKPDA